MGYAALNQCQARFRMPTSATDQNRWKFDREGAWLKPLAGGDRVSLDAVDRLEVVLLRKGTEDVRWCQTAPTATAEEPPKLDDPALPEGALLDEFGQSTVHEWDGRTESEAELVERLEEKRAAAGDHGLPESMSEWGGWADREFEATGYFRTEHDGDRWWLVAPDGHPFWSSGLDCVRSYVQARVDGIEEALSWLPEDEDAREEVLEAREGGGKQANYLAANFVRAFGVDDWHDAWSEVALGKLERLGFNTVANWSEWEIAREAGVPYVRPLNLEFPGTPDVYRDFPDVYHESFRGSAREFAEQLEETREDPAMVGYFLGNEPTWGFSEETPAAGMLYTTETCETRKELAAWLRARHDDLGEAWAMDVEFADVESGEWEATLTEAAEDDLREFSEVMIDRLYRVVSEACDEVDPNHLNLGTRYAYVPGDWAVTGMRHVDVFSINCYQERVEAEEFGRISDLLDLPVLVGEWHFGALDVGLPMSGIGHVPDQAARGDAFRVYVEDAAARPWCVGVHYFTMNDQSALGRYDGETYNIGFLDVCYRAYEPLAAAARASHERLYEVAAGEADPYDDAPEYLPKLF